MIREMAEKLCGVSETAWDKYALRNEPFLGKITDVMKPELLEKSHKCGNDIASEVISRFGKAAPFKLAETMGAAVAYIPGSDSGSYTMFSYFVAPNQICLYRDTVDKALALFLENDIAELVGTGDIREVMVAHELFHFIESARSDLYVSQRLLTLKGFLNRSRSVRVHTLEEVAAMQFTKEILELRVNPFVFDVLLLYSQNQDMATRLYKYILSIA